MNHTTELNWKKYIVTENIKSGIESLSQLFRDQTVYSKVKKKKSNLPKNSLDFKHPKNFMSTAPV